MNEPPRPDHDDLVGEIERLRGELAEARLRLEIVEQSHVTIDLKRRCCFWRKTRLGSTKGK